jgi:hypothetical protein
VELDVRQLWFGMRRTVVNNQDDLSILSSQLTIPFQQPILVNVRGHPSRFVGTIHYWKRVIHLLHPPGILTSPNNNWSTLIAAIKIRAQSNSDSFLASFSAMAFLAFECHCFIWQETVK